MADMIVIQMPGGDVEYLAPGELLWMREALDHENATVTLRTNGDRLYSVEPLAELRRKFGAEDVRFADFTPPEGSVAMVVSAGKVREVEKPGADVFHDQARSILKFGTRLRLAVRENVDEAKGSSRLPAGKTLARGRAEERQALPQRNQRARPRAGNPAVARPAVDGQNCSNRAEWEAGRGLA
jgi:hypothetical protein